MGMKENKEAIETALRIVETAIGKGFNADNGTVNVRKIVHGATLSSKLVSLTDEGVLLFELCTVAGNGSEIVFHPRSWASYEWMDEFLSLVKKAEEFTAEVRRLEQLRNTKTMIASTMLAEKLRKVIEVDA